MVNATLNFQNNLPVSSDQLLEILNDLNIKYDLYNHKPLFTVKDTKKLRKINFSEDQKSVQVKNLYLRDKKKNNYLFVCEQNKIVNLQILKDKLNSSRLSFGSDKRLFEFLGVYSGAVSPFCMINGKKKHVQLFFEIGLKNFDNLFLHPFVCDRSIKLSFYNIKKFLDFYEVKINWISI